VTAAGHPRRHQQLIAMTDTINLQHHRSLSSPDRMAGDYTRLSPYCYCANNPLIIIDPDGNNRVSAQYEDDVLIFGIKMF